MKIEAYFFPEGKTVIDLADELEALLQGKPARLDAAGRNLLMLACEADAPELARRLVGRFGIDELDHEGHTALYIACRNDSSECVKVLVDAGADPKPAGVDESKGAFVAACAGGCLEGVKALIGRTKLHDRRRVHYPYLMGEPSKGQFVNFLKLLRASGNVEAFEWASRWIGDHPKKVDGLSAEEILLWD